MLVVPICTRTGLDGSPTPSPIRCLGVQRVSNGVETESPASRNRRQGSGREIGGFNFNGDPVCGWLEFTVTPWHSMGCGWVGPRKIAEFNG